jgi:branched-chain amino acid transport system substrate-binding protein
MRMIMRQARLALGFVAVAGLGTSLCVVAQAAPVSGDPVVINTILSRSGTGALLGEGQAQALGLAEQMINDEGGIAGRPVHFDIHDDQSSPQLAVQVVTPILAGHPNVLLGPALTATCSAVLPLMRSGPLDYCVSPGIRPEPGSFGFSATIPHDGFVEAVARYFHSRGWNRIALVVSTDSTGQDGERSADRAVGLPDLADMKIVERVHFNPTDVSLTAQIERVAASRPQAIIAWTTGTAMGNVLRTMKQSNLDVPLATSTGNLLYAFMQRFGPVLPSELIFAGGPGMLVDPRLHLPPAVADKVAQRLKLYQAAGLKPDTSAETVWDPAMLLVEALRKLGPDAPAEKIRAYIAGLAAWPGVYGMYDFVHLPQRGLDVHNATLMRWDAAHLDFELISQPGGAPLE